LATKHFLTIKIWIPPTNIFCLHTKGLLLAQGITNALFFRIIELLSLVHTCGSEK
jgi:hypothetical protein